MNFIKLFIRVINTLFFRYLTHCSFFHCSITLSQCVGLDSKSDTHELLASTFTLSRRTVNVFSHRCSAFTQTVWSFWNSFRECIDKPMSFVVYQSKLQIKQNFWGDGPSIGYMNAWYKHSSGLSQKISIFCLSTNTFLLDYDIFDKRTKM